IGVATPAKGAFRAAIFADGTTAGDHASVTMLLESRRLALEQCEAILDGLKAPDVAGKAPDVLVSDLRARVASTLEQRMDGLAPQVDLVAAVSSQLTGQPGPLANQIARAVDQLQQFRKRLLDSKPSLR